MKNIKIFQNFGLPKWGVVTNPHKKNCPTLVRWQKVVLRSPTCIYSKKQKDPICTQCTGYPKKSCLAAGLKYKAAIKRLRKFLFKAIMYQETVLDRNLMMELKNVGSLKKIISMCISS